MILYIVATVFVVGAAVVDILIVVVVVVADMGERRSNQLT